MSRVIPLCAMVTAVTIGLGAQDTKVNSRIKVKADDATVVSLTGCLMQNTAGEYTLDGSVAAAGDDVKTKTKVKTDVDRDKTKVTSSTKADADGRVGTSGRMSTYMLLPSDGVALASHVGQQVQVSAVMLRPGEDDADVKIKDKTTVDPKHAPESTRRSKSKVEVEDVPHGFYSVVDVKALGIPCVR
jgi:hypothetical protein